MSPHSQGESNTWIGRRIGSYCPGCIGQLRKTLPTWLKDSENGLTEQFWILLCGLAEDLRHLVDQIQQHVKQDPVANRLMELRGVGPLIVSALAAAMGNGRQFSKGRDFAASLGLTPRQHSTGGKERWLGISKRGDSDLRKLMIHGARAVVRHAKNRDDHLSRWVNELASRKHVNVVTVALANKTARVAWALIYNEQTMIQLRRPMLKSKVNSE